MLIQSSNPNKFQTNTRYTPGNNSIAFTDSIKKQEQQKVLSFGQETTAPQEKKSSKLSLANNLLNASALAAYTVLVGSAVILSAMKRKQLKDAEKVAKTSKNLLNQFNTLDNGLQTALINKQEVENFKACKAIGTAECKEIKHSPLMKLGEYFGDLKENSDELTNNLVYGFGTLVVMPLVILFSPFGKKDATKEDRIFTIFRQPISFGTLFAAQLTVDKLVKNLVPELNRFGQIKIKDKDGNILNADINTAKKDFKRIFNEKFNLKEQKQMIDNCKNLFDKELKKVQDFIDGQEILIKGKKKFTGEEKEKLVEHYKQKNTLDGDVEKLKELQTKLTEILSLDPEKAKEAKAPDVAGFFADKATSVSVYSSNPKKLNEKSFEKDVLKNFLEPTELKKLAPEMKEVFTVNLRSNAIKNTTSVLMNSVVSQSIGLIALTFVYGKVMKGFINYKKSIGDNAVNDYKNQQTSEVGGNK